MTAPRVNVLFTGETDAVASAIRALTGELRGLTTETRRNGAGAQQAQAQTKAFAERLAMAQRAADPFQRGLLNLYNAHQLNAQAAAAHTRQLDAVAAGMSRAARGTEALNAGFARASAQRAAQDAAATAAATNRAAGATALLASNVGALAKGYVGLRLLSFARQALEEAGALGELSQQTGFAVESLSVLQFGAKQVGLDLNDVATATRRMAVSLGDLRDGNAEASETFAALGLSARDFQGLSVEQSFQLLVDRVAQLPDGLEKAERASRIFGRSGAALIPLLNQLAGDGLGKLERAARAANAVIGEDAAIAADEFGDRLGDLTGALKGLVREGVGPVLPALTEMVRLLTEGAALLARFPSLLKGLPGAGAVPPTRVLPFGAGAVPELLGALGQRRTASVSPEPGGFRGTIGDTHPALSGLGPAPQRATDREITALAALRRAGVASREELERIDQVLVQLRDDFAKTTDVARRAELQSQIASLTKTPEAGAGDRAAVAQDALDRARLEARAAARERERSLLRTLAEGEAADNERALTQGEQSLERFFARRLALIRTATENEVALLEQERQAIVAAPVLTVEERIRRNPRVGRGEAERAREQDLEAQASRLAEVDARIDLTREHGDQQRLAALEQQRVAERQLAEERLGFEQRILQARGQTFATTLVAIEEESRKFAEVLTRQQVGVEERTRRVEEFRQVLTTRAQVDEVSTRAQETFSEIERERERITQEVQVGILTERQGQEQLAALERARLPVLRELAQQMQGFAEQLDNDELRQAAAQLNAQIEQLAVSADLAAQRAARFRSEVADAAEGGIRTVLGPGLDRLGQPNPNSGAIAVREREAEELQRRIDELNEAAAAGNEEAAAQVRILEAEYEALQGRIAELRAESTDFFDVLRQGFTDMLEGIRQVLSELIAADLVEGLRGAFGRRGIPAAPGGLAEQDVGALAAAAPTGEAIQAAVDTAGQQAAAAALAAAAAETTVAAGALAAGAGPITAGAAALGTSAGALSGSGAILLSAAAALQAAAAALAAANAVGAGFAGGGYLDGPGSPTSDSFLIRASRTEFMQPAHAVRFYGLDFMEDVRHLRFPKFATGGLVAGSDGIALPALPSFTLPAFRVPALPAVPSLPDGAAGAPRAELAGELRVLLERGLILDEIRSFMGSREAEEAHVRLSGRTVDRRRGSGT